MLIDESVVRGHSVFVKLVCVHAEVHGTARFEDRKVQSGQKPCHECRRSEDRVPIGQHEQILVA